MKYLASFRKRLAIVSAVGLGLHMLMAATLLYTAQAAGRVSAAAAASQEKTRQFSELQFAADRYHRAAYIVLAAYDETQQNELREAAADFRAVVRNIANLRTTTAAEQAANEHILALSEDVQNMIDRVPSSFRQVDEQWEQRGALGASDTSQQLTKPYFDLVDALRHELAVADTGLRDATSRVEFLRGIVVPVATATLLLLFLCTITIFLLIVLRLSPSLQRLDVGVREFARGQTDHRIAISGQDEFARLAESFNAMIEQINAQQRRLQGAASELESAVERRTAELERANEELAASDQRRRIFFAEVSHELRTPITIIQGEAQLALRQLNGQQELATESFARIFNQTRQLARLIDDLFLIARAEADGLDLQFTDIEVFELLTRVADSFHAIASDYKISIAVASPPGLCVRGDAGRLRQVISAALDNAIRHGGTGISISLDAEWRNEFVDIGIRDTGPGVPPTHFDLLLQRFRRGATTAEGSGLGLTIIRALTEAQGGTVSLSNRSTGGLEVIISLQAAKQPHEDEGSGDAASAVGGRREEGI